LASEQIVEQTNRKREFEREHPEVVASALVASGSDSGAGLDPVVERTEVAALKARVGQLREQYEEAQKQAEALANVEAELTEYQRQKELDEANYRYFAANLEKAKIDEALDPSKIPNISSIQEPVVSKNQDPKLKKVCMMLALAGLGLGVGLAFFIELVLDQTYKRAEDVEDHAALPILLSIPFVGKRPPRRLAAGSGRRSPDGGAVRLPPDGGDGAIVPAVRTAGAHLRPYCEALRDRMMLYFQLKKMVHKPKLVAVTGCSDGAGSSTLASGLAASLSETGGGKVLLVDMNLGKGAVHPFHNGDAVPVLPATFSEDQFQEQQLQENLYLASAADAKTRQALMLPKRFGDLIPRMRASDYDYIIFDMPPVSQTAATLTLSSFMDQVLMVVEAEKSPKENVRKAASLLQQSGTSVFGVFNKSAASGNGWLQPKL
jgi:Mrp family chromosome partitioning ATPase